MGIVHVKGKSVNAMENVTNAKNAMRNQNVRDLLLVKKRKKDQVNYNLSVGLMAAFNIFIIEHEQGEIA